MLDGFIFFCIVYLTFVHTFISLCFLYVSPKIANTMMISFNIIVFLRYSCQNQTLVFVLHLVENIRYKLSSNTFW